MKLVMKTGFMMLVAATLLTACHPDAHKEIGAPRNNVGSLEGTWKLIKATQVDEDATRKGFPFKQLDITTLYPYTDFVLKFNAGSPGTFTTTPGGSPKIIKLLSGSWTVDNADYPQKVTLVNGATSEVITLAGYPVGTSNTLKLKVQKYDIPNPTAVPPVAPKLLITYIYEFAKQ